MTDKPTETTEAAGRKASDSLSELLYSAHYLPGRGRRGCSWHIGNIHAVKPKHGDNFNKALCGKKPKGISLGWTTTSREINCHKCRKKLGI